MGQIGRKRQASHPTIYHIPQAAAPDPKTFVPAEQLATTNKAHHFNKSPGYRVTLNSLLAEEIELRRHLERFATQRRALPLSGRIERNLELIAESGPVLFSSLSGEKDTLLVSA